MVFSFDPWKRYSFQAPGLLDATPLRMAGDVRGGLGAALISGLQARLDQAVADHRVDPDVEIELGVIARRRG